VPTDRCKAVTRIEQIEHRIVEDHVYGLAVDVLERTTELLRRITFLALPLPEIETRQQK
jgi:hypothetical protein